MMGKSGKLLRSAPPNVANGRRKQGFATFDTPKRSKPAKDAANERILRKNVTERMPEDAKGRIFAKNVTEFSGRHWNMKKLCPGKAKFFR